MEEFIKARTHCKLYSEWECDGSCRRKDMSEHQWQTMQCQLEHSQSGQRRRQMCLITPSDFRRPIGPEACHALPAWLFAAPCYTCQAKDCLPVITLASWQMSWTTLAGCQNVCLTAAVLHIGHSAMRGTEGSRTAHECLYGS